MCKMLAGFTNEVDEFTTTILQLKKVPPTHHLNLLLEQLQL